MFYDKGNQNNTSRKPTNISLLLQILPSKGKTKQISLVNDTGT